MCASNTPLRERGFSLVELLIVRAIIATLVAIALPNFFESKQAAHNASAISSLRLLSSAESAYRATNMQYGSFLALNASGYLTDPLLANGQRSNYTFTIPAITLSANFYEVRAAPVVAPWRFYYMDVSGVIRTNVGAPADASSPP